MTNSAAYFRVPEATRTNLRLFGTWIAVQELLSRESETGLYVPEQQVTTVGRVLAIGSGVKEDMLPGDTVLYEQWQGGRWELGDGTRCLIMDVDKVLLVIR